MSSSLPDTLVFRRPRPDDLEVAARILAAEERRVRGESAWGVEETRDWWTWSNLDESWFVDADGESIAFVALMVRGKTAVSWGSVDPRYEGQGLSTELIRRTEQRARELGFEKLNVGMFAENDEARRLFERLGFREVRRFYRMQIELDTPPSPAEWPHGITVSTFRPEDAHAFHGALDEAFADDWGFVSVGFEEWKRRRLESPETDVSLWFIARAGEKIAGVLRGDPRHHGGGWIGALGVRKPWRRRGIANALLRHAFAEYHRRGEPHVGLGVDAQNPTGATRLYERAGMRVVTEDVVFEKELA